MNAFVAMMEEFSYWLVLFRHNLASVPWLWFLGFWIVYYLIFVLLRRHRNNERSIWHPDSPLWQGLVAGLVTGAFGGLFYALAPRLTIAWLLLIVIPAVAGIIAGLLKLKLKGDRSLFDNSIFITEGNVHISPGQKFFNGSLEGITRQIYEQPQTLTGYLISQLLNLAGLVESSMISGGVVLSQGNIPFAGGVSFGSFILAATMGKKPAAGFFHAGRPSRQVKLLRHEYGHYLQSRESGWIYLFKYGIPSASMFVWTEADAEYRSDHRMMKAHGITPAFNSYDQDYKSVRPGVWEYLLMALLIIAGAIKGGLGGSLGGWLVAAGIIAAINMRTRNIPATGVKNPLPK
jgi:hypothetical protein